jgi:hypothetical protein
MRGEKVKDDRSEESSEIMVRRGYSRDGGGGMRKEYSVPIWAERRTLVIVPEGRFHQTITL